MHRYQLLMHLPMLALLAWAVVTDLKERRIPNWLTGSLALAGLIASFLRYSPVTPGDAMLGAMAGFGLSFLLFCLNARGAGDVKLFGAVGMWLGPMTVFQVFVVATLLALVITLIWTAAQGRLRVLFRNAALIVINMLLLRRFDADDVDDASQAVGTDKSRLPYAVPILGAVVLVIGLM